MKHYLPRLSWMQLFCIAIVAFMFAPLAVAAMSSAPSALSISGSSSFLALAGLGALGTVLTPGDDAAPDGKEKAETPPALTLGQQMRAFLSDKTSMQAELVKRDTKISEHEQTIAARDARITELEGKLKAAEDANAQLQADVTEIKDALAAADKNVKELAAKDDDLGKRASEQAKLIVRGAGINADQLPGATTGNPQARTFAELSAEYGKIEDPKAAAEFYAKNIVPLMK